MRVVEAAELIAADLFKGADQNRYRITFGDVERHLAQLADHVPGCSCGRCGLVSRVTAQRVYAIASGWQRQVRATRVRAMRDRRSTASTVARFRRPECVNLRNFRISTRWVRWGDQDPRDAGK